MLPNRWLAGILGATALVALALTVANTPGSPDELLMVAPQQHTEKLFLGEYWCAPSSRSAGRRHEELPYGRVVGGGCVSDPVSSEGWHPGLAAMYTTPESSPTRRRGGAGWMARRPCQASGVRPRGVRGTRFCLIHRVQGFIRIHGR